MSPLKISNAINKEIYDGKISQIDELKIYIKENLDDDFTFTVDGEEKDINGLYDLLDDFSQNIEKKSFSLKSTSKSAGKKLKKKSYYNDWLSQRLVTFAKEQNELDEDERVPNKDRMKIIGPEWKAFKETKDYEKQKKKWEKDNLTAQDTANTKRSQVKSDNVDSDSDDNDIWITI